MNLSSHRYDASGKEGGGDAVQLDPQPYDAAKSDIGRAKPASSAILALEASVLVSTLCRSGRSCPLR